MLDYYDEWLDQDDDYSRPQKIGRTSKAPKQKNYSKTRKQDFRKEKNLKKRSQESFSNEY